MRFAFLPKLTRLMSGCLGVLTLGAALMSSGCGEIITYAGEARQEGIKQYNAGQYTEAAGAFTSAIKQRPQDYQSYYYLGRTYEAMKDYHLAVKEYRTSLRVMENSLTGKEDADFRNKTLEGLASAIATGNDVSLEDAAFTRGGGPVSAEDHFVMAKVRRIQRDADSSLDEFAKAAAADPNNFLVAKEYGLYLLELNQRTKASQELRQAYVLNRRQRHSEDQNISTGLRKCGVIPGPSLGEEADLAKPLIPAGPIPEVDLSKIVSGETSSGQ